MNWLFNICHDLKTIHTNKECLQICLKNPLCNRTAGNVISHDLQMSCRLIFSWNNHYPAYGLLTIFNSKHTSMKRIVKATECILRDFNNWLGVYRSLLTDLLNSWQILKLRATFNNTLRLHLSKLTCLLSVLYKASGSSEHN